jgi:hypothetical protein
MIQKQPSKVIVLECSEKKRYELPSTPLDCVLQDREVGDESQIVYVQNPKYVKGSNEEAPYIALTKTEYEIVEWSE